MSQRIVVINPNSSVDVTDGIDKAMAPLRFADGPRIDCLTLAEGPPGIETQRHVDGVVGPLCEMIQREDNSADAFVVACFSDPGLHSARETTTRPVMGISESGITTALTLGERFGIIAILPAGVARHKRYIRQMGLDGRLAGDRAIGIGVTGLGAEEEVEGRMTAVGKQLIEEDGADVLIMGCAGMARYRQRLEESLGVPVIDPSQAAVADAIAAVRLGYRTNKTNT
ncbi:MAG: Asp/Glu racemase [Rhodospirillaceae bacterium]|jgi:allantoin racemase|nr:Asp/Glu racemase [Rhodospirillaceae bacterium]MBT5895799.1 Asp/Glu racemase [Rhodospirillaceae bacterium]MBT6431211.1 Asp/Glu racemase [Rhodospirillaceae bacterium]